MMRSEVYKELDGERDYQDAKWGHSASSGQPGRGERTIDEFTLYVAAYAQEAVQLASHSLSPELKLDALRKVAGLCVACFEQHGCPPRS